MRKTKDDRNRQHSGKRADLFHQQLKRITAKHHFLSRRTAKQEEQIENHPGPGKARVRPDLQMSAACRKRRSQHQRACKSAIKDSEHKILQRAPAALDANVRQWAAVKHPHRKPVRQYSSSQNPDRRGNYRTEGGRQNRRDEHKSHQNRGHKESHADNRAKTCIGCHRRGRRTGSKILDRAAEPFPARLQIHLERLLMPYRPCAAQPISWYLVLHEPQLDSSFRSSCSMREACKSAAPKPDYFVRISYNSSGKTKMAESTSASPIWKISHFPACACAQKRESPKARPCAFTTGMASSSASCATACAAKSVTSSASNLLKAAAGPVSTSALNICSIRVNWCSGQSSAVKGTARFSSTDPPPLTSKG